MANELQSMKAVLRRFRAKGSIRTSGGLWKAGGSVALPNGRRVSIYGDGSFSVENQKKFRSSGSAKQIGWSFVEAVEGRGRGAKDLAKTLSAAGMKAAKPATSVKSKAKGKGTGGSSGG